MHATDTNVSNSHLSNNRIVDLKLTEHNKTNKSKDYRKFNAY